MLTADKVEQLSWSQYNAKVSIKKKWLKKKKNTSRNPSLQTVFLKVKRKWYLTMNGIYIKTKEKVRIW